VISTYLDTVALCVGYLLMSGTAVWLICIAIGTVWHHLNKTH
jgi:hypothetical protein